MNNTDNIDIGRINVYAVPGAAKGDCLRDSLVLAVKEWRNVSLFHNNDEYRININDLLAAVNIKEQ